MKRLLLIPIAVLFISVSALAETEEECVVGGGRWAIPQNIDPREGDQRLPYCQCEQGYKWNGTTCSQISTQILCESSEGIWADDFCKCPERSMGWNDRIGCDYRENLENSAVSPSDSKIQYPPITILLILLLIGIFIYLFRQKKKKLNGENQHEK